MKYWVYIHTSPSGKKYVGVTTQNKPEGRWGRGKAYNRYFREAIQKYGWDNIIHEAFEVGSLEEMYQKEKSLIALFDTTNPKKGYNLSSGGEKSGLGCHYVCTEEHKRKLSECSFHQDPKYLKKMSNSKKGKTCKPKPYTSEHREAMSRAQKGIPKPKHIYEYLLPDGTTRLLSPQAVGRIYTKKGIKVVRV